MSKGLFRGVQSGGHPVCIVGRHIAAWLVYQSPVQVNDQPTRKLTKVYVVGDDEPFDIEGDASDNLTKAVAGD